MRESKLIDEAYERKLLDAIRTLKAMVCNPSLIESIHGVSFKVTITDKGDNTVTDIYISRLSKHQQ
jgi:hypothetical protein